MFNTFKLGADNPSLGNDTNLGQSVISILISQMILSLFSKNKATFQIGREIMVTDLECRNNLTLSFPNVTS